MNEYEEKNLVMQQYRLYAEQKDTFINRSFSVNRFYLILSIILLVLINLTQNVLFAYSLTLPFVFCLVGMGICILWWMNMDSYNLLIKIKFSKVLEEIEKQLPIQPYGDEHTAIEEYRTNKKAFLFSDIQKVFAIILFLMFFVALLNELIPMIIKTFFL